MSECRSCDAPVIWAVHIGTGKVAPIDVDPVEGGNVMLMVDEDVTRYRIIKPEDQADERHTNHFATCPDGGLVHR